MQISIILAHPDQASFNHAIAHTAAETVRRAGTAVCFHDLYAEKFDPLMPAREFSRSARLDPALQAHCDELRIADGIIIVHPNWWGQPPAMLKGWIDRVIRPGMAYEFVAGDSGEGVPRGLLQAKWALVFTTSNTPAEREKEIFHDPLEAIWKDCVFGLCCIKKVERKNFSVMVTSTQVEREGWLKEAAETTARYL
jgi:NAD(P)H dehydrogenase (quinone)